MIYFNVNIRHPGWWKRFKNIKVWSGGTFVKNKFWEIQVLESDNLFRIEFEWTARQDHAGVNLELGLFGYQIHLAVYDCRHWDIEQDCWMNH